MRKSKLDALIAEVLGKKGFGPGTFGWVKVKPPIDGTGLRATKHLAVMFHNTTANLRITTKMAKRAILEMLEKLPQLGEERLIPVNVTGYRERQIDIGESDEGESFR
jgi:hypothetical protein